MISLCDPVISCTTAFVPFSVTPARFGTARQRSRLAPHKRCISSPFRASKTKIRATAAAAVRPEPGRDFYGIPNPPLGSRLLLGDLRERLIRQEETIIFAFIERAQFKVNELVYQEGVFSLPGDARTFLEYLLHNVEAAYAKVRRYTSPDEHPFAPHNSLPDPILPALEFPKTLIPNDINVNPRILEMYVDSIVPVICDAGDDQNYGSAATADVACLQALSKRIHYGKFIAEAKVQENREEYERLAKARDRAGIYHLLSDETVEDVLLRRVENKARSYGSDVTVFGAREVYKVKPQTISRIYKDFIIPLTKEVEIDYIILQCGQDEGKSAH